MDKRYAGLRLAGRVAIVTGAGSKRGVVRATTMRLAQEGADVVVERSDGVFPNHTTRNVICS